MTETRVTQQYSIFDDVADEFSYPFCALTDELATRQFITSMSQAPELRINAKDYHLYRIGRFDKATGVITPEKPKLIKKGEELDL